MVLKLYVTVGASECDYITDGVDDAVQIQAAIDYCYANSGPKTVVLLNQEYNLGDNSIHIKPQIELRGMVAPRMDSDGVPYSVGICASLNVTSTTKSAIVMHSGSVLRRIRIDYPQQSASNVIEYPAAIVDVPQYQGGSIASILIEDVTGCMPYSFIDFSAPNTNRVDYVVKRIRGDPLVSGVRIGYCGHVAMFEDIQFVPGFGGRIYPGHGQLINYMGDNLTAFYAGPGTNLDGNFVSCKTWVNKNGFYFAPGGGMAVIDCMADASQFPLTFDNCDRCRVIGGVFQAFHQSWDGVNYVGAWEETQVACRIMNASSRIVINNACFVSASHGVRIDAGSHDNIISSCDFQATGMKDTSTRCAGIFDCGTRTIMSGNLFSQQTESCGGDGHVLQGAAAIIMNGVDSNAIGNVVRIERFALGGVMVAGDGLGATRPIVDGLGWNAGDPNIAGDWCGSLKGPSAHRMGVIINDWMNGKQYVDVSPFGVTGPIWDEI